MGGVVAHQPVGIAAAVPALVVPAADLVAELLELGVAGVGEALEEFGPRQGVAFVGLELLVGQVLLLLEQPLGQRDRADVVQRRRHGDGRHVGGGEPVLVGPGHEVAQQDLGEGVYAHDVQPARAAAELRDVREDGDHEVAGLLARQDLVGHGLGERLLVGVEHDGVGDALVHHLGVEGPVDEVDGPQLVGALGVGAGGLGGDHDDGNVLDPLLVVHHGQHVEAVHAGHHDVEEHEVDVGSAFAQDGNGLLAAGGLDHLVAV